LLRSAPASTLFPYTTLFRSRLHHRRVRRIERVLVLLDQLRLCGERNMRRVERHVQKERLVFVVVNELQCVARVVVFALAPFGGRDRKSTRLNSSHLGISYAV